MHIMDGYLPLTHAALWTAVSAPFLVAGYRTLVREGREADGRFTLAAATAFTLLLSSLKLPSVAGSSSHPTGTGLGTMLAGPSVMSLVALLVLVFQALLLAHGGLTTLGANVVSMGVVGPWCAWWTFRILTKAGVPAVVAIGAAAALGDLSTYLTTSLQLALAHPEAGRSVATAFVRFAGVFAITQLPIAALEGVLTALVFRALPTVSRPGMSSRASASVYAS